MSGWTVWTQRPGAAARPVPPNFRTLETRTSGILKPDIECVKFMTKTHTHAYRTLTQRVFTATSARPSLSAGALVGLLSLALQRLGADAVQVRLLLLADVAL